MKKLMKMTMTMMVVKMMVVKRRTKMSEVDEDGCLGKPKLVQFQETQFDLN